MPPPTASASRCSWGRPRTSISARSSKSFETDATGDGIKVTIYSSPFDPALQAQQIDDAIAQKFDLFVVQIISQRAIIPVLTRVKNAGIPVVLVVAPMVGNEASAQDLYLTHVGYDDETFGRLIGEAMVKAQKDSGRSQGQDRNPRGLDGRRQSPAAGEGVPRRDRQEPGHGGGGDRGREVESGGRRARGRPAARALRRPGRARRLLRHERRGCQRGHPGGGGGGREGRHRRPAT